MQIRESAENYLETILILSQRKGKGEVRSIENLTSENNKDKENSVG